MFLLLAYISLAVGISFLCSLLEATLLASRNATLTEQREQGIRGAGLLLDIKRNRVDDAISAILTLNTVANTLGATLAGAQASRVFGSAWIGVFSGALTFLILVVSEIIPKTLGAVYSRSLAWLVGWALAGLTWAMSPVLVLSRTLTRLLTRGGSTPFSRGELAAVLGRAEQEGTISAEEARLFSNLLRVHDVRVKSVMTPRTVAVMMPAESTVDKLLQNRRADGLSRIPLYREDADDIVGYVLQDDVLRGIADGSGRERRLESFKREIWFVPELATVGSAMGQFLARREPIAMVTDEHGGVSGLVTLEDLTETFLGQEIIDESDQVVDLRELAQRLRDRRLRRRAAGQDRDRDEG